MIDLKLQLAQARYKLMKMRMKNLKKQDLTQLWEKMNLGN